MQGDFHTFHVVFYIYHHFVALTDLNGRSGDHPVRREDASFYTIGQDALTVGPNRVGGVRGAHLASPEEKF